MFCCSLSLVTGGSGGGGGTVKPPPTKLYWIFVILPPSFFAPHLCPLHLPSLPPSLSLPIEGWIAHNCWWTPGPPYSTAFASAMINVTAAFLKLMMAELDTWDISLSSCVPASVGRKIVCARHYKSHDEAAAVSSRPCMAVCVCACILRAVLFPHPMHVSIKWRNNHCISIEMPNFWYLLLKGRKRRGRKIWSEPRAKLMEIHTKKMDKNCFVRCRAWQRYTLTLYILKLLAQSLGLPRIHVAVQISSASLLSGLFASFHYHCKYQIAVNGHRSSPDVA